ncbi:HipA N-terminal domain-containing protein [Microvirga sp. STR05]|uniref:HipA N-terminal domain-containing protein n=1 Tax=Hymenobacter duratus TaxID=2771356 RepID=A0ABR8JNH8_9BACT|nr:HipA N-terminal domain-containing protein [Hymenobacter duratus]MBD2717298.1 HipA N-terminal domain-containing protein [Hymenobacter duratus]MBR7952218.1 HipA N-terminal domain-containing protein [Microvirga sp. STR05]
MRRAEVYLHAQLAGHLIQDEQGYTFAYTPAYLATAGAEAVSLTLPLRPAPYVERVLFPFFDGLIPEGWLLEVAEKNWKLNARDRMGLLLACCRDCIGAVSILPLETEDES